MFPRRPIHALDVVNVLDRLEQILNLKHWARALRSPAAPKPESSVVVTPRVRCREIMATDLDGVTALLTAGFQRDRDGGYWQDAIRRLSRHQTPQGLPKYGFLLENGGRPVGVLLMIASVRPVNGAMQVRCNFSSLYVMPAFRMYAPLLIKRSARFKDVTYLNITPSPHTWPMLEAQGYRRFSDGLFIAVPALSPSPADMRIYAVTSPAGLSGAVDVAPFEIDLLLAHAGFGCISVICEIDGTALAFVFALRWKYGIRFAHLIYCRDHADFVRLAGPLGRYLARRGAGFVVLDATGPVRGLPGFYLPVRPKYWLGAHPPRLGDLAYTERVMFGF